MLTVVFWKEWRQQGTLLAAILVLAGVALGSVALTMPHEWAALNVQAGLAHTLIFALMTLVVSLGIVTGAILFAGEAEEGTLTYLDQHSGARGPVWRAKMIAGLSIVIAGSFVIGCMLIGLGIAPLFWLFFAVWFGIDTLLWASVCSASSQGTFRAIGAAALLLIAVSGFPLGWLTEDATILIYFLVKIPLMGFAVVLSHYRFCAHDRHRFAGDLAVKGEPRHPGWIRVSLWMFWRRSWMGLITGLIVAVLLTMISARAPRALAWPVLASLIGCLCGLACFADPPGAERYLGDQRLPRGRLWLGKIVPWLVVAIGGFFLCAVIRSFVVGSAWRQDHGTPFLHWSASGTQVILALLAFGVQGFALGQFIAQWTTKLPVAVFLSVMTSLAVGAAWYPSLQAMMNPWPVFALGLALLAGTRINLPRWTSGRLHDWSGLAQLALWAALIPGWIALNLWWRVAEIPDVGEPFDVRAFKDELIQAKPSRVGLALQDAVERMEDRLRESEQIVNPVIPGFEGGGGEGGAPGGEAPGAAAGGPGLLPAIEAGAAEGMAFEPEPLPFEKGFLNWGNQVLWQGLPAKPKKVIEYVDHVFAGDWVKPFREAALAEPDSPRSARTLQHKAQLLQTAGQLFLLRATVAQSQGRTDAAIADIEVAFATARHCLYRSEFALAEQGLGLQSISLGVVSRMMQAADANGDLFAKLGKVLERHEARLPSFADNIKAAYLQREDYEARQHDSWRFAPIGVQAPWERARDDRLLRALVDGMLQETEQGTYARMPDHFMAAAADLFGLPTTTGPASTLSRERWRRILQSYGDDLTPAHTPDVPYPGRSIATQRIFYGLGLLELRGRRLTLAAAQRQLQTGQAIAELDELVPEYFARLPVSPVRGMVFEYRVASGEQINVRGTAHTAQRGQGVVSAGDRSFWALVPMPRKK